MTKSYGSSSLIFNTTARVIFAVSIFCATLFLMDILVVSFIPFGLIFDLVSHLGNGLIQFQVQILFLVLLIIILLVINTTSVKITILPKLLQIILFPLFTLRKLWSWIFSNKICVGSFNSKNYYVELDEFKQGGIICGAIGTGKTTLRLQIMKQMISKGISILDIDYKGDAPKMKIFAKKGLVLVPGINLHIDLFSKPNHISEKDFVGVLYRSFLETIADSEITSPQKIILHEAIKKTIGKRGNLQDFFDNIILVGVEAKSLIDNYQKQSALALVNKFLWLQSNLGSVFSVSGETLSPKDLLRKNVYLDLSSIQHKSSILHLRFLIDIIITQIMIEVQSLESDNFRKNKVNLRKLIFLDEAHMLIPPSKNREFTRLEELVATLRFKGLSVIATTTDMNLISKVLHDSNFIAQFRTQNTNSYTLKETKIEQRPSTLKNFEFLLKCGSTDYLPKKISTIQFKQSIIDLNKYYNSLISYEVANNNEFVLSNMKLNLLPLEAKIYDSLLIKPKRHVLKTFARKQFLESDIGGFLSTDLEVKNIIYHHLFKYMENESIGDEYKSHSMLRGFLIEILLLCFGHNYSMIYNKQISSKVENQFKHTATQIFMNLVNFIDLINEEHSTKADEMKILVH